MGIFSRGKGNFIKLYEINEGVNEMRGNIAQNRTEVARCKYCKYVLNVRFRRDVREIAAGLSALTQTPQQPNVMGKHRPVHGRTATHDLLPPIKSWMAGLMDSCGPPLKIISQGNSGQPNPLRQQQKNRTTSYNLLLANGVSFSSRKEEVMCVSCPITSRIP